MATLGIKTILQAHCANGKPVKPEDFTIPLRADQEAPYAITYGTSKWSASQILFFQYVISSFQDKPEPNEDMAQKIAEEFQSTAGWINQRSEIFKRLQSDELNLNIFISLWIDQDQIQLTIPSDFLSAVGCASLKIDLITNDFGLTISDQSVAVDNFLLD